MPVFQMGMSCLFVRGKLCSANLSDGDGQLISERKTV